jgi:hypothetical protein
MRQLVGDSLERAALDTDPELASDRFTSVLALDPLGGGAPANVDPMRPSKLTPLGLRLLGSHPRPRGTECRAPARRRANPNDLRLASASLPRCDPVAEAPSH